MKKIITICFMVLSFNVLACRLDHECGLGNTCEKDFREMEGVCKSKSFNYQEKTFNYKKDSCYSDANCQFGYRCLKLQNNAGRGICVQ